MQKEAIMKYENIFGFTDDLKAEINKKVPSNTYVAIGLNKGVLS